MTEELTTIEKPSTPFDLVQMAIDRDLDVVKLKELLSMQKEWQANQARQLYFDAMNRVQSSLPRVIKNKENTHTRSRYADLEAVNTLVMPVFSECGFSVSFNETECDVPDAIRLVANVRHVGGHQEDFTAIIPIDGAGMKGNATKNATQAKGSTIAYGRRYLMLMIGNVIVSEEDTDGNAAPSTLTETELEILRTKFHEHIDAGLGKGCTVEQYEANVVKWLAADQQTPDVDELEGIHSVQFAKCIKMLDKKIRDRVAGRAE